MKRVLIILLAVMLCSTYVLAASIEGEFIHDKSLAFTVDELVGMARSSGILGEGNIVVDPTKDYRGLFMTKTLIPYVMCEADGIYCPQSSQFGEEHLKIEFLKNGDMIESVTFETAQYDEGWGPCVYMYMKFAEKAGQADPQTQIKAALYYEKDGHKTCNIYLNFYLYELPESLQGSSIRVLEEDLADLIDLVDGYVAQMRSGVLGKVDLQVDPTLSYRGRFMTQSLIPYVLCETDGVYCPQSSQFGAEHMKVKYLTNENLVKELRFEMKDNNDGWGPCIQMYVSFTDAAAQADPKTVINTAIYFEKDGHKTQDINVNFYLYEMVKPPQGGIQIVEDEDPPANTVTSVTGTVNVKQGRASIPVAKTSDFAAWKCRLEGDPCGTLAGCTAADLKVEFERGEELVKITFSEGEDGIAMMDVALTAAGRKADLSETISGKVYISKEANYLTHISEGIPFEISLESQKADVDVDPVVIVLIVVVAVLAVSVVVAAVLLLKKKK